MRNLSSRQVNLGAVKEIVAAAHAVCCIRQVDYLCLIKSTPFAKMSDELQMPRVFIWVLHRDRWYI